MIKCLLVSALPYFLAAEPTHPTQIKGDSFAPVVCDQKCQDMRLEIALTPATEQGATIFLTLPSDAEIRVLLWPSDKEGLPEEAKLVNGQLNNVPRGTYDLIVQDKGRKYCPELRSVTVE